MLDWKLAVMNYGLMIHNFSNSSWRSNIILSLAKIWGRKKMISSLVRSKCAKIPVYLIFLLLKVKHSNTCDEQPLPLWVSMSQHWCVYWSHWWPTQVKDWLKSISKSTCILLIVWSCRLGLISIHITKMWAGSDANTQMNTVPSGLQSQRSTGHWWCSVMWLLHRSHL